MENSMQEVQTNKSEKLVPIDTSGEAIDIELKEDKVENVNTKKYRLILLLLKFKKKILLQLKLKKKNLKNIV